MVYPRRLVYGGVRRKHKHSPRTLHARKGGWQAIEADYHSCRLSSGKAEKAAEQVFADCMANRGYVYMYPVDAEQLHNDIAFEMEKDPEKWQNQVVTATIAASPITITSAPPVTSATSDSGGYAKYLLGIAAIGGIAAVASGGGGGGGGNSPSITPTPTMTITMPQPPTTPTRYEITSPELGGWHLADSGGSFWLVIFPVPEQGIGITANNQHANIQRSMITQLSTMGIDVPELDRSRLYSENYSLISLLSPEARHLPNTGLPGTLNYLRDELYQIFVDTRPDIVNITDLCAARWIGNYINSQIYPGMSPLCSYPSSTSFSPDIRQVVYAAMADGFNQGFGIGESGFAFSGRYDDNNRAAGFTYDFGGYAFRTDYTHLPSKQDSEVWLDTYRFGVLTPINDEVRFYAGVDSYNNAIFAIDAKGDTMHRLGFAIGDGYAARYEYRIRFR